MEIVSIRIGSDVSIWGKRAESLEQHLTKGKQITVYGELKVRKYETDKGEGTSVEIRVNEFDFGGSNDKSSDSSGGSSESKESKRRWR